MSRHNHDHCLHDLKYCEHCDTVYCTKCDREWSGHAHYYYSQPYIWYYTGVPYTITWGSTGNYTIATSTGQTVNDVQVRNAFENSSEAHSFKAQTGELSSACTYHN